MLFYWRAQLVEILPFSWKTLGTRFIFLMQTNTFCHNILLRKVPYYHLYYLAALRATSCQEMRSTFFHVKKDKMADRSPLGFACLIKPSKGPIIARRGKVISDRLANRFGSRFGTKTKLLRGVIGPISTPNDWQYSMMWLDCAGAAETMPSHGPHGKSLNLCLLLVTILSLRVKSLFL